MMLAQNLSAQIMRLSFLFIAITLLAGGGLALWAASQIDSVAVQRQASAVIIGLDEVADSLPVEQDSSAIWDESVVAVRAGDDAWLAENLVEWMSEYYGHEFIFLLDPDNGPVRAVASGLRVEDARYETMRGAVEPLAVAVRAALVAGSEELPPPQWARLNDETAGVVSVRPIIPSTSAITQRPKDAYLHVSIRLIDDAMLRSIGSKFDVDGLRFSPNAAAPASLASVPLKNADGRVVGVLSWNPYRPAWQLLSRTAPVLGIAGLTTGFGVMLLIWRLRRTSDQLQVSEAQAKYLALHDALAKVPNRALFEDRLGQAMANRRISGGKLALHAIDLDRFKQVNDTLGHQAGDELIRQVATRLGRLVRDADTVARLGGDEFSILQVGIHDIEDALKLGQRIVTELGRPFDLNGHEVEAGASVGIAVSDQDPEEAEDLLRHADTALYEAKTNGRGRYQLFAVELNEQVRERRTLELELRAALQGEPGLSLAYQPIFDARTGGILGAEALLRWTNPRRGPVPPSAFIPLAEDRGLIDALGLWALREACQFAAGSDIPWVAVNVSPLQFRDERFAGRVLDALEKAKLAPSRLELEVTEGLLLQNSPVVQEALRRIRATGTRVALDDFGTGYSSISYLRSYGVDKLKIDQSFVAQLGIDLEIGDIVRCIIDLAKAMHIKVTAEGVETEAQRRILSEMGCNQLQGYLLSHPISAEALADLLRDKAQRALTA